jgi:3-methyladenine DNA glycosylase AlkD
MHESSTERHRKKILKELRRELTKYADKKYRVNAQQFSKEKLKNPWVLKTPITRRVSGEFFKRVKDLPKKEILTLCDELLQSGNSEENDIAFDWARRCTERFEKSDFRVFESWLKRYVKGWGSCDHICVGALGELLFQYPEFVAKTEQWARSRNRWLRRASAVVLIYSLRRSQMLPSALKVADILLQDREDLVQKGYGWMLKEASNRFPKEVFEYVMKHKREMPRTALRYAIEKLPVELRKEAMKKDWLKPQ